MKRHLIFKSARTREPILTPQILENAALDVHRTSPDGKMAMADELYLAQPNLLLSVLTLNRSIGASMEQTETLIELLLVIWLAMKASNHQWPLITEEMQQNSLARLAGKIRLSEQLPASQKERHIKQHLDTHPEPYLLALVHTELENQGWLQIHDKTVKELVLVSLNLVESVATASHC
ncbi:hypothetical protein G5B35_06575 [Parapusillimonas sp. SGNA-6]|nr:hypothetical protein [Parapusillimonas sp. SGNA-6]